MQNGHVLKKSNFDLLTPTPGTRGGGGTQRGGGGTLIFSHIRRPGLLFGVQNSEFQFFFLGGGGGVEKSVYFLGV